MKIQLKRHSGRAFSLMEVMIAIAVFFMAIFAILELTSRNLKMARALRQTTVDPGMAAAAIALTNSLEEASESGDFAPEYPDVKWSRTITEWSSNGLFHVQIVVSQPVNGKYVDTPMEILLFRPKGAPTPAQIRSGTGSQTGGANAGGRTGGSTGGGGTTLRMR
jgi:hypothetical protein